MRRDIPPDIYPITVYVDRRLWPVTWEFEAPTPAAALIAAMQHARKILVPGCEVLLRTDGLVMHRILPRDPKYVSPD